MGKESNSDVIGYAERVVSERETARNEWTVVTNVKKEKVSLNDKHKSNGKGKVIVLGDSLVKGVGECLEHQSDMFSSRAYSGLRIEHTETKGTQLGDNPDSHLILMVGTNNLKSEGSELMAKKYVKVINEAKKHKFRKISVVSILDRTDVGDLYDSRRLAVNRRLKGICKENGVDFPWISDVRKHLSRDGLHLNRNGQELVSSEIFTYCKLYLN